MTEVDGSRACALAPPAGEGTPAAFLRLPGLSAVAALGAAVGGLLHDPIALRLPAVAIAVAVALGAGSVLLLAFVARRLPAAARVQLQRIGHVAGIAEAIEVAACLAAMALRPEWIGALSVALAGLIGLHAAGRLALVWRLRSAGEGEASGDGT